MLSSLFCHFCCSLTKSTRKVSVSFMSCRRIVERTAIGASVSGFGLAVHRGVPVIHSIHETLVIWIKQINNTVQTQKSTRNVRESIQIIWSLENGNNIMLLRYWHSYVAEVIEHFNTILDQITLQHCLNQSLSSFLQPKESNLSSHHCVAHVSPKHKELGSADLSCRARNASDGQTNVCDTGLSLPACMQPELMH